MSYPIIEQIMQAVKRALDGVVADGDASQVERPLYHQTQTELSHKGLVINSQQSLPYCDLRKQLSDKGLVMMQGDPRPDDQGYVAGHKCWIVEVYVYCCIVPSETSTTPIDTEVNTLLAHVEKAMRDDPTWGGLAQDTQILGPLGFTGDTVAGSVARAEIHFRHNEDDPFTIS